jgi:sterol desaturase/sphingolipid hydroxylase (fatty acid hydroxylase superfamily)
VRDLTPFDLTALAWAGPVAFAVALVWEALAPARPRETARARRWATNLGLWALGAGLLRLVPAVGAVGVAALAAQHQVGLLPLLELPTVAAGVLAVVVLDLGLYAQHRAMHRIPALWRWHAPHHSDPEVDASTALRFHPGEMVFSVAWKGLLVLALGPPVAAVVVFETLLAVLPALHHANGRLPARLEQGLGLVLITPRLHRWHHDADGGAASGNYGFSTSLWDRLFGTLVVGRDGQDAPTRLGLKEVPARAGSALWPSLTQPFNAPGPASPETAPPDPPAASSHH